MKRNGLVPRFILKNYVKKNKSGTFKAVSLFLDLSHFSDTTEELMKNGKEGAEVISDIINDIFSPSIELIYKNKGFVTGFAGDSFTAVFPEKGSNKFEFGLRILKLAIEIRDVYSSYTNYPTKFGQFSFIPKIGISYGETEWNIISSKRISCYYFKGNAIENSAETETHAKSNWIVFDSKFLELISESVNAKEYKSISGSCFRYTGSYIKIDKYKIRTDSHKKKTNSTSISIPPRFVPESVLKSKISGEFREIVSCFISFSTKTGKWQPYISRIAELSCSYGGYFNKISFDDKGGSVMILFGIPVCYEDFQLRACDFALKVKSLCQDEFGIRIGLALGNVFAGFIGSGLRSEFTAIGMTVNLSARLALKSHWKDIFISENLLKEVKDRYLTETFESVKLKGFSKKIPVIKLKQIKHADKPDHYDGYFTGREKELIQFEEYIKPVFRKSFGGIIYINGNAGIGKSSFLREFRRRISVKQGKTFKWFNIHCDSINRLSFNPFTDLLNEVFEQSVSNSRRKNEENFESAFNQITDSVRKKDVKKELIRTKSLLGALLNIRWEGSNYENMTPVSIRNNTIDAVKNLLIALSLSEPVVVEIDNCNNIDIDSVKIIKHFFKKQLNCPVVFLSLCRFDDEGKEFLLWDGGSEYIKKINLKKLNSRDSHRLVYSILSERIAGFKSKKTYSETADLICRRSSGNPMFIEQITDYVLDRFPDIENMNIQNPGLSIPSSINSVILSRIDRLDNDIKELAEKASVIGSNINIDLLKAIINKSDIKNLMEKACSKNIFIRTNRKEYSFRHILIKDTIYGTLLKKQTRSIHRRIAEYIEKNYKNEIENRIVTLAEHYEKAEIYNKSVKYLILSGKKSQSIYSNSQARRFYVRAVKIMNKYFREDDPAKSSLSDILKIDKDHRTNYIEVIVSIGDIFQTTGQWDNCHSYYTYALNLSEKIADEKLTADVKLKLGYYYFTKGKVDRAFDFYNDALETYLKKDLIKEAAYVYRNLGIIYERKSQFEKALEYYSKSLKISENMKDIRNYAVTTGHIGNIYKYKCNYDKALKFFEEQLEIQLELNYREGLLQSYNNMGMIYESESDFEKAMASYKKANDISIELGHKQNSAILIGNIGVIYENLNDYKKALKFYRKSFKLSEELNDVWGLAIMSGNIGIIYLRKGMYKKSLDCFTKQIKLTKILGDKHTLASAYSYMGEIYREKSDYKKAVEFYNKQLKISTEINDKKGIAQSLKNTANIFAMKGSYKNALIEYKKSLKMTEDIGDKKNIADIMCNMALICQTNSDIQQAIILFGRSIDLYKELQYKRGEAVSYMNLGILYNNIFSYYFALENYNRAYDIAKSLNEKRLISAISGNIGVVYENQGDFRKAIEFYEKDYKLSHKLGDKYGALNALQNLAMIHLLLKDFTTALKNCNKASSLAEVISEIPLINTLLVLKADILLNMEKHKDVLTLIGETKESFAESDSELQLRLKLIKLTAVFYLSASKEDKINESIIPIENLLSELKNEKDLLSCKTALHQMYKYIKMPEPTGRYYKESLAILDDLYKSTRKHEYVIRKKSLEESFS